MSVQSLRKEISSINSKIQRLNNKISDRSEKLKNFGDAKLSTGDIYDRADVSLWRLEIADAKLQISILEDSKKLLTSKLKDAMILRDLEKRKNKTKQPKTENPGEMGSN